MSRWAIAVLFAGFLGVPGCAEPESDPEPEPAETLDPLVIPPDCNPLAADWDCMLPYPSDYFLVKDPALPSGKRVHYPDAARVRNHEGEPVSIRRMTADGFSHQAHLIALFPAGVGPQSVAGSLVLVEADSGHRPLILVELDPRAEDPARQGLIARPRERLKNGTRYVVGIRGLVGTDGEPLQAPEGFRRVRDGLAGGDPVLEPLQERYETEVFPALAEAGFAREDLLLAWDFTTQTREHVTADMMDVRRLMLEAVEKDGVPITVTSVEEPADGSIGRLVIGEMTLPLFLDQPEAGAVLHRGEDGRVAANGTAQVPFTVQIPRSVIEGTKPPGARLFQYGHGFFGERAEVTWSYCAPFADEHGVVFAAVEWWGMDHTDRGVVAEKLVGDPENTLVFVERVHQGIANQLAFTVALEGPIATLEEVQVDGQPAWDADRVFFHGLSQGHILGGTLFPLSPDLDAAALGVGGAMFSHMMMRSSNFREFLQLMQASSTDPLDQSKIVATTATTIDRFDPITYAPYVSAEPLEGNPPKRILLQIGIGDAQVPNLTSRIHARALGIPTLNPAPVPLEGIGGVDAPAESAYVEYDFELEISPLPGERAVPPREDNPVHEAVRRTPAARAQLDGFLREGGKVEQHCEGPCNPE